MTSHDDLVHSNQIEGGYRVSTAVTAPDPNGVTSNDSATVHTNFDQDAITMHRDGSFAVFDDGDQVELGRGESATLSGGETVTANQDGSLTVNARGAHGGTIATTLRGTGGGVDVTTHAHELALGGDAIAHGAPKPPGAPHPPGMPNAHGGHHHRHTPVKPVIPPERVQAHAHRRKAGVDQPGEALGQRAVGVEVDRAVAARGADLRDRALDRRDAQQRLALAALAERHDPVRHTLEVADRDAGEVVRVRLERDARLRRGQPRVRRELPAA